jgi:hypothetical protein
MITVRESGSGRPEKAESGLAKKRRQDTTCRRFYTRVGHFVIIQAQRATQRQARTSP